MDCTVLFYVVMRFDPRVSESVRDDWIMIQRQADIDIEREEKKRNSEERQR